MYESQAVLQQSGEIERRVIEYQSGTKDVEAIAAIIISLSMITAEYGSTYNFVAGRCDAIKEAVNKLSRVRIYQHWRAEKLKILILKECVALRQYVSLIKTLMVS